MYVYTHYIVQYLFYLLVQASDVAVLFCGALIEFHCLHSGVIPTHQQQCRAHTQGSTVSMHSLGWQLVQNEVGIFVDALWKEAFLTLSVSPPPPSPSPPPPPLPPPPPALSSKCCHSPPSRQVTGSQGPPNQSLAGSTSEQRRIVIIS